MIPVIDLFAGPGGLGEGFSAFRTGQKRVFKIALSIERDKSARETLRLRSFFRQFLDEVPKSYYDFLRGTKTLEELYQQHPTEAARADEEAWLAELGNPERYSTSEIDNRIERALDGAAKWVLIGGPPCQAYSLVGRSRMAQERERHEQDRRHFLYQEYLRILAVHRPPVFVMENVKGIGLYDTVISRKEAQEVFENIPADLKPHHHPRRPTGETLPRRERLRSG